ncbi:MAG: spermidine/putrescine ABC transporter substrate-binding protein [Acidimicrobiia bacterium]|nr:spermidine/putrescine ABC transporter substrate-binding protein [Acidimicrobiia bacterium]
MTTSRLRWTVAFAAFTLILAACGGDDSETAAGGTECAVGETDGNLALYNWAEYIDPEHLDAFAAEFGIEATMTEYDSNEAMLPVVSAGNSGYDVIVPSDYMVGIMIDGGFVQPLNFDAIPNASNISDEFANPSYDPEQAYSVPYQWGYTGLAVNTAVVGTDFPRSWSIVFGDNVPAEAAGKITLLNDPRETMGAALKALGYSLNTTDQAELDEAQDLVEAAKDNLLRFDTDSADELLTSGESVIAHGYSGDMFTQFLETDDPSQWLFFVPEEGGTRWIDNMVIPFDAPHPCTAHTFINWLLDGEEGAALSNWNYYGTPNKASIDLLDEELNAFLTDPTVLPGGLDNIEEIADTGDFEINYSDALNNAKG